MMIFVLLLDVRNGNICLALVEIHSFITQIASAPTYRSPKLARSLFLDGNSVAVPHTHARTGITWLACRIVYVAMAIGPESTPYAPKTVSVFRFDSHYRID